MKKFLVILFAAILTLSLAACGNSTNTQSTDTQDSATTDTASTEAGATEGNGPATIDAGYFTCDIPEGASYTIDASPASGSNISQVSVFDANNTGNQLKVSSGTGCHSQDGIAAQCKLEFDGFGGTYTAGDDVDYNGYTYKTFVYTDQYSPAPKKYFATYDEANDLFVECYFVMNDDGTTLVDQNLADSLLGSLKVQAAATQGDSAPVDINDVGATQ